MVFDPATLAALGSLGSLFGGKGTEVTTSQSSSNATNFSISNQISNVLPGGSGGSQTSSGDPALSTSATADASASNPTSGFGGFGSVLPDFSTTPSGSGAVTDTTGTGAGGPSAGVLLIVGIVGAAGVFLLTGPKRKKKRR